MEKDPVGHRIQLEKELGCAGMESGQASAEHAAGQPPIVNALSIENSIVRPTCRKLCAEVGSAGDGPSGLAEGRRSPPPAEVVPTEATAAVLAAGLLGGMEWGGIGEVG